MNINLQQIGQILPKYAQPGEYITIFGQGYFFESHCTYGPCCLVALCIFTRYYAADQLKLQCIKRYFIHSVPEVLYGYFCE